MARVANSPDLCSPSSRSSREGGVSCPRGNRAETIHDLRNMLAVIASGAHVLGRHGASAELRGVIDAVQDAAQTAGQLVARLAAEIGDRDGAGLPARSESAGRHSTPAPFS